MYLWHVSVSTSLQQNVLLGQIETWLFHFIWIQNQLPRTSYSWVM